MSEDSASNVRVSYIITTRNRAEFLDRILNNVREFITPADEVIVIDGGSTDHTIEVVSRHKDLIVFFESERDHGEAHGFNKGILKSNGRYIKILTDDDYFYPEAMRCAISVLEEHPELDAILCGGEGYRFDPVTGESELVGYQYLPSPTRLTEDAQNIISHVFCGLGLLLARRVIARVGLFDTSFHAVDTDYLFRLFASGANFKYVNVKLYRHLAHQDSGHKNLEKCNRDAVRVFLRSGLWNEVVRHPPLLLGNVLGLNKVAGGKLLMRTLYDLDWLRRRLLPLFIIYAYLIHVPISSLWTIAKRIKRKVDILSRPSPDTLTQTIRPVEPKWDKSLR